MEKGQGKNMALLVGCNYPNTPSELRGCHNDVTATRATLINVFGFDPKNIEVLMDKPGTKTRATPTGANIKRALRRLVSQLRAGDVLFFHFSGHGTRFPSPKSPSEFVEAIVPSDYNLITSVDFRKLVDRVPKGATFVFLSDSCHSGGLIDKEEEQIGPNRQISFPIGRINSRYYKPRMIPFESLLEILLQILSIARGLINVPLDIARGLINMPLDIATIMLQMFGNEASLMFVLPRNQLPEPLKPDQGILLSACQSDEYAADVKSDNGEQCYGAFTHAIQVIVNEKLLPRPFSNRQLVVKAREIVKTRILKDYPGHKQHPCLYCSDENVNHFFLSSAKKG